MSFTVRNRGPYELHVQLNNVEISDSLSHITVYPDPKELVKPVGVIRSLRTPYSICFNVKGEMIVSEKLKHQISTFTKAPRRKDRSRCFGGKELMMFPQGIAIDNKDNIYVTSTHKLQKFNCNHDLIKTVESGFNDPYGITLYDDEVYVCDCNMHRIQVFNLDLDYIRSIGSYGRRSGKFDRPYGVQFDRVGNMYVAEWGNERVQVLNSRGHFIQMFGEDEKLSRPSGLHIIDKYVYVSDYSGGRVVVYKTSGKYVTSFGQWGPSHGEFIYPYCITSCSDGFIYVCDRENSRIQIF